MLFKPENRLLLQWSPSQIIGLLKTDGVLIIHESIYQYIWEDTLKGRCLYTNLRHKGRKYKR